MMEFDLLTNEEKVETENGALGYKTTKSKLLDLSFKVPAMRMDILNNKNVNLYKDYFEEAYHEDPENALRFLLYLRDARGGLGERDAFRNILIHMAEKEPDIVLKFLTGVDVPNYGRWDDVIEIAFGVNSHLININVLKLIKYQLLHDYRFMNHNESVSLLAKWMPSENSSSKKSQNRARALAKFLGMSSSEYRKILSALRKYIDVIERKMSANDWENIDYEKVPSKANIVYKKAFLKHDEARRNEYLQKVNSGESKINAKVLAPYEIVRAYNNGHAALDVTLETLWDNLPAPSVRKNVLVVRDGSGSMTCNCFAGNITPMDIGDSIALYMAKFNKGSYKDKFITFSSKPRIVDLSYDKTLGDKLKKLKRYTECSNTDLEKVFDLVLATVIENNVPQEEIPDILIISDMEFDDATGPDYYHRSNEGRNRTLLKTIAKRWKKEGYDLPKLIFWNVASRSNAIPLRENENGVILVSGFSSSLANMVMSNELDPLKALLKILHNERYDVVKSIM